MSITVLTIKSSQIRMPTQPALWAIRVSSRSRAVSRSSNVAGWAFWARKPSSLQISRTICVPPPVVFFVIVAVWPWMRKGRSGLPLKKFFNTSGLLYKSMALKDKLPGMSEEEMIKLLATDGMLVKRPLLVGEDFVLVGFKEGQWGEMLEVE